MLIYTTDNIFGISGFGCGLFPGVDMLLDALLAVVDEFFETFFKINSS